MIIMRSPHTLDSSVDAALETPLTDMERRCLYECLLVPGGVAKDATFRTAHGMKLADLKTLKNQTMTKIRTHLGSLGIHSVYDCSDVKNI